ncbi:MAG: hypothetical protein AVDCRST_MAG17-224, partial [uncultured Solirubrobacterales bacterium]
GSRTTRSRRPSRAARSKQRLP